MKQTEQGAMRGRRLSTQKGNLEHFSLSEESTHKQIKIIQGVSTTRISFPLWMHNKELIYSSRERIFIKLKKILPRKSYSTVK